MIYVYSKIELIGVVTREKLIYIFLLPRKKMPSMTLTLSDFFKIPNLNVALLPILNEQSQREPKDQYTFHVYNRLDNDKEPVLLGGGTEETLNECIIEGLRILEREGRNLWNFLSGGGSESSRPQIIEDWKEFIYDWVIDDSMREKYPWDKYWDVEPEELPSIEISLDRIACEICDIIMDESESFFIYIDSDDSSDFSEGSYSGSETDWSDWTSEDDDFSDEDQ